MQKTLLSIFQVGNIHGTLYGMVNDNPKQRQWGFQPGRKQLLHFTELAEKKVIESDDEKQAKQIKVVGSLHKILSNG